jgi:hypothetical protein
VRFGHTEILIRARIIDVLRPKRRRAALSTMCTTPLLPTTPIISGCCRRTIAAPSRLRSSRVRSDRAPPAPLRRLQRLVALADLRQHLVEGVDEKPQVIVAEAVRRKFLSSATWRAPPRPGAPPGR